MVYAALSILRNMTTMQFYVVHWGGEKERERVSGGQTLVGGFSDSVNVFSVPLAICDYDGLTVGEISKCSTCEIAIVPWRNIFRRNFVYIRFFTYK